MKISEGMPIGSKFKKTFTTSSLFENNESCDLQSFLLSEQTNSHKFESEL